MLNVLVVFISFVEPRCISPTIGKPELEDDEHSQKDYLAQYWSRKLATDLDEQALLMLIC